MKYPSFRRGERGSVVTLGAARGTATGGGWLQLRRWRVSRGSGSIRHSAPGPGIEQDRCDGCRSPACASRSSAVRLSIERSAYGEALVRQRLEGRAKRRNDRSGRLGIFAMRRLKSSGSRARARSDASVLRNCVSRSCPALRAASLARRRSTSSTEAASSSLAI